MAKFKSARRIKLDYAKTIIVSILIPIGFLWAWHVGYPSTINEFLLLTHQSKIANGFITKAEEVEDRVETNNDRKTEKTLDFFFEYTFTSPSGKSITSFSAQCT